ncbi:MAG: DNA mismatch repair endonuclease MutL [Armatimonadota bacterium]|nr:DNA mismatch repair endonuclease MutL [Armatimonadota bacterium]
MGRRIALLDSHTVNQIAAGEVVERPASVVKELIENAIDAGATRIEVRCEGAGKSLIAVADNGCGMGFDDAEASLQRHATSKIKCAGDLLKVTSLGFRGEAVPSIASVSRMTVSTGMGSEGRLRLQVEYGKVASRETIAGPQGTDIEVRDLFGNTPARLKFLKSDNSETAAIAEVVSKYATAHPEVAFMLRFGGQTSISTPGTGDLLDSLAQVWGADFARSLAEIDTVVNGLRVQGFVAPPHVNKPGRSHQLFFVNGRPIRSKTLYAAVDAAYRSLTPERRYAAVALQMSIDPADVDVNVSPTKNEVKFHREGLAFDAVRLAVKGGLMEHGLMPSAAHAFATVEAGVSAGPMPEPPIELVADLFRQLAPPPLEPGERFPFGDLLEDLRILGQVMNTFIVCSTKRGIAIIDQHVAHERVLYEYLCGLRGGGPVEMQRLISPETVEFEKPAAHALLERLEDLRAVGFEVVPFGTQAFLVRAVPAAAKGKDFHGILRDVAAGLIETDGRVRPETLREKIWITTACRMAVKAGDPLTHHEMEHLIRELAGTENPYLCPHGRPITITLTADELLRRFKRT